MDIKLQINSIKMCRICLQISEEGEEMGSIFDQDENSVCLYEKIERCGGIKILTKPDLPTRICTKCNTFLTFAHKFRIMCKNSDYYLREYILKANMHSEDSDSNSEYSMEFSPIAHVLHHAGHNVNDEQNENFSEICLEEGEDIIVEDHGDSSQFSQQQKTSYTAPRETTDATSDRIQVIPLRNERKKEKQIYICDICGNIYPRKYALEAHMRRHRNERPYECEICSQSFHLNSQLTRHIRKHAGVRPYVCQYCKRTFARRSTMLEHERIHRNERPYTCDICDKSFTYSSVLKVHKVTHTGEKPFICGICGKRFSRAHHLRAHLETLLHQKDPRSKVLLKEIKREEDFLNIFKQAKFN